jgi:hypothetical protein
MGKAPGGHDQSPYTDSKASSLKLCVPPGAALGGERHLGDLRDVHPVADGNAICPAATSPRTRRPAHNPEESLALFPC